MVLGLGIDNSDAIRRRFAACPRQSFGSALDGPSRAAYCQSIPQGWSQQAKQSPGTRALGRGFVSSRGLGCFFPAVTPIGGHSVMLMGPSFPVTILPGIITKLGSVP